jgi:hypothetical protein
MAIDFEVARKYAFWCKKREPSSAVSVLRVEIPNATIESLSGEERFGLYWPSEEWKQLFWTCRRRQSLRNQLAKYARATLVIGTICAMPNDVIANLASSDNITQRMIFTKEDGGNAVQFAFIDDQGLELLAARGIKYVAHPSSMLLTPWVVAMYKNWRLLQATCRQSIAIAVLWVNGIPLAVRQLL